MYLSDPVTVLSRGLAFLNHPPPKTLGTLASLWDWAIENWSLAKLRPAEGKSSKG